MKNTRLFIIILTWAGMILSCQKEDSSSLEKGIVVVNIGLFLNVSEVENQLKSYFIPSDAADDFTVAIYDNRNNNQVLQFAKVSEMPEEISLDPGQYYITAHSNNNLPAAFENPYYFGKSEVFTITSGGQTAVTINCALANTIVSVTYTESLRSNYTDYTATVSTSAGSLVYTRDETRSGYFQPLPINITVQLKYQKNDGTIELKTITGIIPAPEARKKYEVKVEASSLHGTGAFGIVVDETAIPVEVVPITDNDLPASGIFEPGELLITEIMYDPVTLIDSEGEWFEIYNNTNRNVDINQLAIRKNDTESHIINASIILAPHQYYVCSRTANAVSVADYVYGTAISLNNAGASLSLYNYGTNGKDGSQICLVNYGTEGFPSATGASIILSPTLLTYLNVGLGSAWCKSSSVYNAADLGTPGAPNDACLTP
jgi:hypothetical protein